MILKDRLCPFIGQCGGCSNLKPYDVQLADKQNLIEDLLSYYGKVWPIIGAEKPFYYRNKANWEFSCDRQGKQFDGIYAKDSHYIIPVGSCMLHDKVAQSIINDVASYFRHENIPFYNEDSKEGFLRHVLVRRSPLTDQSMVCLITGFWKFPHKESFINFITEKHPDVVSIIQNRNKEKTSMIFSDEEDRILFGNGYIEDYMCNLKFRISGRSFSQVNPYQASELYSVAMDMADFKGNEKVIDAYCGTGTIGLIASDNGAGEVIGIENNQSAVADAMENAKLNGITNARFVCADASSYLKQLAKDKKIVDVVFLDPPRNGTDERFLSSVFKLNPKKIIYISCNPFTLNRDLRYIVHFSDYRVQAIQPVDMFPQTSHVETVVMMSRI